MIIAHVFYSMVKQESDTISVGHSTHVKYLIIGFGLPIIVTGIGIYDGWFGNYLGIACTIKTGDVSQMSIPFVYGISLPICLTFVVMSGFYLKSLVYLRSFGDPSLARKICYETVLYPIVFLLVNLFFFVDNVVNSLEGDSIFWLALIALILRRLQGFFDAVIYGYNSQVRSELAGYLARRSGAKSADCISMQAEDPLNLIE